MRRLQRNRLGRTSVFAVLTCLTFAAFALEPTSAHAQERSQDGEHSNSEMARQWMRWIGRLNPPSVFERSHGTVTDAFREAVAPAAASTVEIEVDGTPKALGAVVHSDGYIITKASEVVDYASAPLGKIVCSLSGGRQLNGVVVGVSEEHDLAMLKVAAAELPAVQWSLSTAPSVGSLLATSGQDDSPLAIGVASVDVRKIRRERGVLGIEIRTDNQGPRVGRVMADSAAKRAGLTAGDLVLSVNGKTVHNATELSETIGANLPGAVIRLLVRRGDKEEEISATLDRHFPDPHERRRAFQESLGTRLSQRRGGFPSVFQHDTVLRPRQCGGPVVGLDGKVVGINIARAGRVATYAVPAAVVKTLLPDLINGALAPKSATNQMVNAVDGE